MHIWKRYNFSAENHRKFNPQQSSSFKWGSEALSIQYGTGSMTGYLASDVVEVTRTPGTKCNVYLDFKRAYLRGLLNCDWQLSCVSRWAASLCPTRCLELATQRLPSWLAWRPMVSWDWPSSPLPPTMSCLSSTTWSARDWCPRTCSPSTWAGTETGWKSVGWECVCHFLWH